MSTETWGTMPKSLTDPTTIDEEIANLLASHNADAAAHLVSGGSLDAHKSDSVIDHPAGSVINDKVPSKTITPDQQLIDKFFIQFQFESIDAWQKSFIGADGLCQLGIGGILIQPAAVVNDSFSMYPLTLFGGPVYSKNPYLQFAFQIASAGANVDVGVLCGSEDPYSDTEASFGFYWKGATGKLSCRYYQGGTPHDYDLATYDQTVPHILRIELGSSGTILTWYVDNVQVYQATGISCLVSSDSICGLGIKNLSGASGLVAAIGNIIYSQDL